MTRRRMATAAPLSARNGRRTRQPGILATASDDAHAVGQERDPTHRADGYYDLPTARPHPVVQPSQYRLGFRWRGQIACERDFDNRKHPDGRRSCRRN